MVIASVDATRTSANNKAIYMMLIKSFISFNVWIKHSHESLHGLEWGYPLYTQIHKLVKRTGEQKTDVVPQGTNFWLLHLTVKTSQYVERQLAAMGYVLKICSDLLAIKVTYSYLRLWGRFCGHFPGLLIRFVGGMEIAAM